MVYLFVPNIIGYARVALAVTSVLVALNNPLAFFVCYALSQLLDALDGYAARAFNQSTKFGAVLDMVTDRVSTAALVVVLVHLYPTWMNLLILVNAVDLASHYAHLYVTLVKGESSHKNVDENSNVLLRLYYGNRYVLFTLCAANEAIFLLPYVLHFDSLPGVPATVPWKVVATYAWYVSLPLGALKQLMNVVQLINAFVGLAQIDIASRASSGSASKKGDTPKKSGAASHSPPKAEKHVAEKKKKVSYEEAPDDLVPLDKQRQAEVLSALEVAESQGRSSPAKRTRRSFASAPKKLK